MAPKQTGHGHRAHERAQHAHKIQRSGFPTSGVSPFQPQIVCAQPALPASTHPRGLSVSVFPSASGASGGNGRIERRATGQPAHPGGRNARRLIEPPPLRFQHSASQPTGTPWQRTVACRGYTAGGPQPCWSLCIDNLQDLRCWRFVQPPIHHVVSPSTRGQVQRGHQAQGRPR